MKISLQYQQISIYFFTILTLGLTIGVFGPTVDELAENADTDVPSLGFLLTARGFGGLTTALGSGFLLEKFPGHNLLSLYLMIMLVSIVATPFMTSFGGLITCFAITGMSIGGVITTTNGLSMWSSPHNTGMVLNIIHGAFGIGSFIVPLLALGADKLTGSYNLVYYFISTCCAVLIVIMWFIPSPTCPEVDPSKQENLLSPRQSVSVVEMHSIAIVENPQTKERPVYFKPSYLLLMLYFLSILLAVGPEHTFGSWVNMYAVSLDMSDDDGKLLTTAYWISFTAGRFGIAALLICFTVRVVFFWELVLCGISALIMLILPANTTVLWLVSLGFGFGISAVFSNIMALASSYFTITGRINGLFSTGFSAGDVLTPAIVAFLMGKDNSNYGPIAFVSSIAVMTLMLISFSALAEIKAKSELKKEKNKQARALSLPSDDTNPK